MTPHAPAKVTGQFAIGVRYLTGYAVAALPSGGAEWPPHWARLFMALVAACHETGGDMEELAALRWLEQQNPPEIIASACDYRETVTTYVPPNDFTAKDPNILPQWRTNRQPRVFPRARPHSDTVHFIWPTEPDPQHLNALEQLCGKVTRLGHSSSLVQVWVQAAPVEEDGRDRYRPSDCGGTRLRHINAGTLEYLADLYREADIEDHFRLGAEVAGAKGKAKTQAQAAYEQRFGRPWKRNAPPPERLRPEMSAATAYEQVVDGVAVHHSCFDPTLVMLRLVPRRSRFRRLATASSPRVCDTFRKAIIHHAPDDLAVINGHAADGSPLRTPHLAVMPLPFAGSSHADGHLLGVAAVLPREIEPRDRMAVLQAIRKVKDEGLRLAELGEWDLVDVPFDERRRNLRAETWTVDEFQQPAQCWATVTPIALDRHPKAKDPVEQQEQVAAQIRRSCTAIGLPEPVQVIPFPVSVFTGVPDARCYPRLARKDGSKRRQMHALLWFDEPVIGPVLLGAGRFRGWGVCRPYEGGWK